MSKSQAVKAERVSRLSIVREGGAEKGTPTMPRRGRLTVDIESIVPDPRNERKNFRGIDELSETIKRVGIIEPPTVVPLDDGRFMLTTGERRWRAAKQAGEKRIAVIVGDPEEEQKRRVKSLISNVQREDLGAVELANALQEMKEDNPAIKTNRDLATVIGKSEQWVGQMLKVLSLPKPLQKQLAESEKQVAYDVAIEIARVEDESGQKALVKEAVGGATVRVIREKAKSLKTSKRKAKKPTYTTEKIKVSKGWVIIHYEDASASREDQIAALSEALKALKAQKD